MSRSATASRAEGQMRGCDDEAEQAVKMWGQTAPTIVVRTPMRSRWLRMHDQHLACLRARVQDEVRPRLPLHLLNEAVDFRFADPARDQSP